MPRFNEGDLVFYSPDLGFVPVTDRIVLIVDVIKNGESVDQYLIYDPTKQVSYACFGFELAEKID